jgi:hypothetical protein
LHTVRRAIHVLELAGAQRPQKYRETGSAQQQARGQQIKDNCHDTPRVRARRLFSITSSDEPDIAAASQGVTNPATASSTISML